MEHISEVVERKSKEFQRRPRFVKWAVMIGIVIVLNLFFMVMRELIFQEPNYNDFCPATPIAPTPAIAPASANAPYDTTACNAAYQKADTQYQLNNFIMLVGLGVLAIIIGVLPLGSSIVSSGLSYGGVLAFVIASAEYWSDAGNWLRFAISLIALVTLIYIGFKRFKD